MYCGLKIPLPVWIRSSLKFLCYWLAPKFLSKCRSRIIQACTSSVDKYIKSWWDENVKNEERLLTFFCSDRILPLVCPELNLSKNFTQITSNLWITVSLVVWVFKFFFPYSWNDFGLIECSCTHVCCIVSCPKQLVHKHSFYFKWNWINLWLVCSRGKGYKEDRNCLSVSCLIFKFFLRGPFFIEKCFILWENKSLCLLKVQQAAFWWGWFSRIVTFLMDSYVW